MGTPPRIFLFLGALPEDASLTPAVLDAIAPVAFQEEGGRGVGKFHSNAAEARLATDFWATLAPTRLHCREEA